MVGLDYLEVTAVHRIKGIFHVGEYHFLIPTMKEVYGKNPEGSAAALADIPDPVVPAGQLKGMADEENILFLNVGFIVVPAFCLMQPVEILFFPLAALRFQGASGPATGNENIILHAGNLLPEAYIKFIHFQIQVLGFSELVQNFPDTTHALVGNAFIQVKDSYFKRRTTV